ncbi:MAG: hypothetical protein PHT37_01390, partial [Candidatus Cloacimonetes bacterium]|nr:hypothetical protein [Candidatus Cloacimonadota bacterium]
MKKLFLLSLCCMIGLAFAEVPDYYFTHAPDALMTSYYDYMIGSYNSLPLRTIPDAAGGGYHLTFHAKTTPTGVRSV